MAGRCAVATVKPSPSRAAFLYLERGTVVGKVGGRLAACSIGGKEAEEKHLLPYPQKGGHTSMPDRGGKQKHVSMITHNGGPHQTIVRPNVAPHMHINMILIRKDEHHVEMCG